MLINKEIEIRGAQYGIPAPFRSTIGVNEVDKNNLADAHSSETTLIGNSDVRVVIQITSDNVVLDGLTITS